MIQLEQIDHVAIRATDPERSARWYGEVLGLARVSVPEWEPYPIMMLSGEQGIAIFPADKVPDPSQATGTPARIDHIAFRVDADNFLRAQQHLQNLDIPFTIQDHIYFHSIYIHDPDHHQIELTMPVKSWPKT